MSDSETSTYVCQLTPGGRSAVAVVAVAGPTAATAVGHFFDAVSGGSLDERPLGRIVYGRWVSARGVAGEDVIVCRQAADVWEVHCHGGYQAAPQILADLGQQGCLPLDWTDWLRRQASGQLTAEAQLDLAAATTERTAGILLDQFHGALASAVADIRADLAKANFPRASAALEQLLAYAELGLHLTQPWKVVLAGLPNVGKSSLINALVGYRRAIVFDQPGTTRDVVAVTTAVEGWPLELSDTAGLHAAAVGVEEAGIARARQQIQAADLVLWVLDATQLTADDSPGGNSANHSEGGQCEGGRACPRLERGAANQCEGGGAANQCELPLGRRGPAPVGRYAAGTYQSSSPFAARRCWHVAQAQAEAVRLELSPKNTLLVVNKLDLVPGLAVAGAQSMRTAYQNPWLSPPRKPRGATQCDPEIQPCIFEICCSALTGDGLQQLLASMVRGLVPASPPPGAAVPFRAAQVAGLTAAAAACAQADAEGALRMLECLQG